MGTTGFVSVFIAIGTGSYDLSIINFILGKNTGLQNIVLLEIRVPRVILSAIVGASLGIAGAALQGLFHIDEKVAMTNMQ